MVIRILILHVWSKQVPKIKIYHWWHNIAHGGGENKTRGGGEQTRWRRRDTRRKHGGGGEAQRQEAKMLGGCTVAGVYQLLSEGRKWNCTINAGCRRKVKGAGRISLPLSLWFGPKAPKGESVNKNITKKNTSHSPKSHQS